MPIRAIFFDAFKTLVDLRPSIAGAFAELCRDFKYAISDAQVAAILPRVERAHYAKYDGAAADFRCSVEDLYERWVDFNAMIFAAVGIDGDKAEMSRAMEQRFNSGRYTGSYADSHATLERLAARGFKLGIISNGTAGVRECLAELGYESRVDFIIVSALAGWEKPSPRIFRIGLERAGVAAAETLFIGDNYQADVLGARNAGMQALQIVRDGEVKPAEEFYLKQLNELEDWLADAQFGC